MNITLEELLRGKSTLIKTKEFLPTKNYVEPFLDKMSKFTSDFRIQVKLPDQITKTKDTDDLTYNRVLIQGVLPQKYTIDNHEEVIGMLYGIDVKKPVVKIFRNYLNQACTNLTVFSPQWINTQELIPGDPINFAPIKNLMELTNNFATTLQSIKNEYVDRDGRTNYLGSWVDNSLRFSEDYGFGRVKIAVSTPIDAYKLLFMNKDSDYYIPEGIDPSIFDIYNAFTDIISKDQKDIMNKFEKIMIINKLLGINEGD